LAGLSKVVTIVLSLVAVTVCRTPNPECDAGGCYRAGLGQILGVLTNVFAGVALLAQGIVAIAAMPKMKLFLQNRSGNFVFTEHNPASHIDENIDSLQASLIYSLPREKVLAAVAVASAGAIIVAITISTTAITISTTTYHCCYHHLYYSSTRCGGRRSLTRSILLFQWQISSLIVSNCPLWRARSGLKRLAKPRSRDLPQ
jgi:hypothetical protein